jgi:hypothetical protein
MDQSKTMSELSPNQQAQRALQKQHEKLLARLRERNFKGAAKPDEEEEQDNE